MRIAALKHALHTEPHEFGPVRVHDFHSLDERLYDQMQHGLEGAGFRCFGDVEDLSVSAVFPSQRTAIRDFASDDGLVAGFSWQVNGHGWLGARKRRVQAVELVTGFSDGRFLSTANQAGFDGGDPVPGIERIQVPDAPSAGLLDIVHRARLEEILAENQEIVPVLVQTHRDVRRTAERAHALRCAASVREGSDRKVRRADFIPAASGWGAGTASSRVARSFPLARHPGR
jgi:hypothetical protein